MIVKKEKQILIFDDDKNLVKYDINTDAIIFGTVNNNKLLHMSIESVKEYFEDENMWFMFRDICKKENCNTLIRALGEFYKYKNFEQIYSAGLKVFMTPSEYGYNGNFDYTIKDIPKGLRRICKENNFYLDNRMVQSYLQNPDIYNAVFFIKDEYKGLKKTNLKLLTESKTQNTLFLVWLHDCFGYNIRDLARYFDYLKTEFKMRNMQNMIKEYKDYVKKSFYVYEVFEKYPKNFAEAYQQVSITYKDMKKEQRNKAAKKLAEQRRQLEKAYFEKHIKHEYEIEYKDYVFIYPKSAEEIRKEGRNNHNCVATYIQNVIEHRCDILFLRKKDAPNKSLVTIEVRNGKIVQARRVCNSDITEEDKEAIMYFNKLFSKQPEFFDNNEDFENMV